MANRLKFRKILRKIHLASSIVIFAYLLMYFVTAFILIRHDWFPHASPVTTRQTVDFKIESKSTDFTSLTPAIKKHLDITGRTDIPFQRKDGCWVYNVYRPGISHHIVLNQEQEKLTVSTTEQLTVARVSSRLHLMRFYKGSIKYYIWAFFYDLSAISMLLFGLSGILIWLKMKKAYRNGLYYLLSGTAISVAVLVYLLI